MKEGGNEGGPGFAPSDAFEGLAGRVAEFPEVLRAEVGEFVFLPIGPEVLDRIEFRGVGRQPLDVQPVTLGVEESGDEPTAVNRSSIPQQEDFAGQLPVQGAEEGNHLRAADRSSVQLEVKVLPGQSGNRRDILPVKVEGQDRGLTTQGPRPGPMWPLT